MKSSGKIRRPYKSPRRVWRVERYVDAVIAGVAEGKTLAQICKSIPSRPPVHALRVYFKRNPDQRARYKAAQAKAKQARRSGQSNVYMAALEALAATDCPFVSKWHEPGLPNLNAMRIRGYRDPAYMAKLKAVLAQRGIEPHAISDDVYDAALKALAASNEPDQTKWREPGLPTLATMRARARRDPAFKERLDAMLAERARRIKPKRFRARDYPRALELAQQNPDLSQDEIDVLLDRAMLPMFDGMRAFTRRNSVFAKAFQQFRNSREALRYSDDAYETALDMLRSEPRLSCGDILPERVGLIPSWEAVRRRAAGHPDYAERYHAAMEERRAARGGKHLRRPGRTLPSTAPVAVSNDLMAAVDAAIPRWVDAVDRDDIRSDVVMAVLSGEIGPTDIGPYARQVTKRLGRRAYDHLSVDSMARDDGEESFLDLKSSQSFTFEDAI